MWKFYLIFLQFLHFVESTWPISSSSNVQILGLFETISNDSELSFIPRQCHAMFQSAIILSQRYNIKVNNQSIGCQIGQTKGNSIYALNHTCRSLTTSNIIGVIGPPYSREAHVIAAFAKEINIPVISYSATDPTLSERETYPSFYRTIPSDGLIALKIVELFIRFNWTSCIIIYQNDQFGSNGADSISDAFDKNKLTITDFVVFDMATASIRGNFKDTLTHSLSRIVLLWADETRTSIILQTALLNDLIGPHFLWILSANIPLDSFNETYYDKLIGILTITATVGSQINTTLLNAAYEIWQEYEPETFPGTGNVYDHALFTFDGTWFLIQSLQNYSYSFRTNSTFCFDIHYDNFDLLMKKLNQLQFLGVTGPIRFNENVTDRIDGNIFLIKNVQLTANDINFVSVLKYVDENGWQKYDKSSVIIWPNNTLIPPTGFPKLDAVKLRIGLIQSAPFVMTKNVIDASGKENVQLVGFILDFIDRLQTVTGFIPELVLAPSNTTYGGMIQAVVDNVYDIVIGDITVTSTRREIVDFSTPFYDNTFSVIIKKDSTVKLDYFSYLKPFSRNVWLTLLGAWLYAAIIFWILERNINDSLREKSTMCSIMLSIWYSLCTIVGFGVEFAVQTAAGRILTFGLYMLSIVLVATYTANLASDLTLLKSQGIISGIDDLKNGKIPFSRIGILVNSSFEDYFLREISSGSRNYYPLKEQNEIYTNLIENRIDASIMDTGILQYVTNTLYCDLTLVGATFNPNVYAIVIPKQWLYTRTMDVQILALKEAGFLNDLITKWFQGQTCSDSSSDSSTAISISSLAGLFLTFLVITALALLLFLWTKRFTIKDYLRRTEFKKKLQRYFKSK
ncbi:unnamed protein product [Adineta ricciae]|uniref:Ionotropic glutamate receptor C-terminal domain-containing protein n=3 Tax=Adineta ricciae TaxID=249248 RepID=A0A815IU54_ADIRI|nr:unnamed protein product [Adineta ricciae]